MTDTPKAPTEAETEERLKEEREATKKGAFEQAQKCIAFVREATELAKESGRDVEEILTDMMRIRFESLRSAKFLAESIGNTFMETRERVMLVCQGLLKNPAKDGQDIVMRLGGLCDNLQRSAETAMREAEKEAEKMAKKQAETVGRA